MVSQSEEEKQFPRGAGKKARQQDAFCFNSSSNWLRGRRKLRCLDQNNFFEAREKARQQDAFCSIFRLIGWEGDVD